MWLLTLLRKRKHVAGETFAEDGLFDEVGWVTRRGLPGSAHLEVLLGGGGQRRVRIRIRTALPPPLREIPRSGARKRRTVPLDRWASQSGDVRLGTRVPVLEIVEIREQTGVFGFEVGPRGLVLFVPFGEFGVGVCPGETLAFHVVSPGGEGEVGVDELLVFGFEGDKGLPTLFESVEGIGVGLLEGDDLGAEGVEGVGGRRVGGRGS